MDRDTDRWVRSDEARAKLRDLLDEIAADGAHVYVLRYDKPAAVLVPVDWYESVRAGLERGEPAPEGLHAVASADTLERVMKRLAGMPVEGGAFGHGSANTVVRHSHGLDEPCPGCPEEGGRK